MTSDEMIAVYKAANKYKSFRSKSAKYKVQDRVGGEWRTLFCFDNLMAAQGFITMRRGKEPGRCPCFRVLDRAGEVVYT